VDKEPLNETDFFAQRGFGLRIGSGERPSLVIIDLAEAFTDQKAMLGTNLDKAIVATKHSSRRRIRARCQVIPGNTSDSKATLTLMRLPSTSVQQIEGWSTNWALRANIRNQVGTLDEIEAVVYTAKANPTRFRREAVFSGRNHCGTS
jgi:hypothetical protein